MKKTIILITFLTFLKVEAQNPIINIVGKDGTRLTGAYYKDVNNVLNQFEGTYIYTNGNISFKIVLEKKIQQYNGRYYEDLIIGEYEHKINNVVVNSTLNLLPTVYNDQWHHCIVGNSLCRNDYRPWPCPDCETNELRLDLSLKDKNTLRYANLVVRKVTISGQEALQAKIFNINGLPYDPGSPPAEFSLPVGEMTFYKQ